MTVSGHGKDSLSFWTLGGKMVVCACDQCLYARSARLGVGSVCHRSGVLGAAWGPLAGQCS